MLKRMSESLLYFLLSLLSLRQYLFRLFVVPCVGTLTLNEVYYRLYGTLFENGVNSLHILMEGTVYVSLVPEDHL